MAEMSPFVSPDDCGYDDPQSVAGDPAIVHPRGFEVQPLFWPLAGSARVGRRPRLPGAFGLEGPWASLNQVVWALRFFYGVTLGCEAIPERIAYAREPRKLPATLECPPMRRR